MEEGEAGQDQAKARGTRAEGRDSLPGWGKMQGARGAQLGKLRQGMASTCHSPMQTVNEAGRKWTHLCPHGPLASDLGPSPGLGHGALASPVRRPSGGSSGCLAVGRHLKVKEPHQKVPTWLMCQVRDEADCVWPSLWEEAPPPSQAKGRLQRNAMPPSPQTRASLQLPSQREPTTAAGWPTAASSSG